MAGHTIFLNLHIRRRLANDCFVDFFTHRTCLDCWPAERPVFPMTLLPSPHYNPRLPAPPLSTVWHARSKR